MWRPETRFDRRWLACHLHPDFVEFGRSGRVYRRDDLLSALEQSGLTTIDCDLPLPDFRAVALARAVVLVTYDSHVRHDGRVQHGHRTSLWLRDGKRWRMRLHQGTPFDPDEPTGAGRPVSPE